MKSTKKARRFQMLVLGGVLLAVAAALFGFLARDAIAFFKDPSQLVAGEFREDQLLRVGGMVVEGSLGKDGAAVLFDVTDGAESVTIRFEGVLPDRFRKGQGIVAEGYWKSGTFSATEVLAKHDEKYMPPEVAAAMKEKGVFEKATE